MRPYVLRFAGRPPTLNHERSHHWSEHREVTKAYRDEATLRARTAGIPRLDEVEVRSFPTYRNRQSWPDVAAWFPATKAIIDGFVDAGILPSDTCQVVRRNTFDSPRLGTRDELVVVLIPWVRASGGAHVVDELVDALAVEERRSA